MRAARVVAALFFALSSAGMVAADGDINLIVGQKSSGEGLFDDAGVGDQTVAGLAVNLEFDWPVVLALDLLMSSDDGARTFTGLSPVRVDTDVETVEIDVGVRKIFGRREIVPYLGAGVSWTRLEVDQTITSSLGTGSEFTETLLDDHDSDLGFWLGGGLIYRFGNRLNLGCDLRYTSAKPGLNPVDEDTRADFQAGGRHYSLLLGYRW